MVTVNPSTSVNSGASSQLQKTAAKIQTSIANLLSGSKASRAADDISSLSIASQLQAQLGSLKSAASNLTQALSVTEVADEGIAQQIEIVDRLQQLATTASSPALGDNERQALETEFQGLVEQLNRNAENTQFNGQKLLDGSFSLDLNQALGNETAEDSTIEIDDLSAPSLFEGKSLSISTAEGASEALSALSVARDTLLTARAEVGSFSQTVDYASASIESAVFNQEAARSEIADFDFGEAATQLALLNVQRNLQLATAAQSNKLPANILDLLS